MPSRSLGELDVKSAVAIAHPMEGLLKYHGLIDWDLRIPYHDSISVNLEALYTKTEVQFGDFEEDFVLINKSGIQGRALERVLAVINYVRKLADSDQKVRVISENNLTTSEGKGLGFSSSGGAALATAAFKALGLEKKYGWDVMLLSKIARRLAGSACRSVVGEYARWYAGNSDETSFARKIGNRENLDLGIIVVPLSLDIKTEDAHREAAQSPFLLARIKSVEEKVEKMEKAIKDGDLKTVGIIAEKDTFELHAVTMTGESGLLVHRPESLEVIDVVRKAREEGIEAYFSMQTGPTVYINTYPENVGEIEKRLQPLGLRTIVSRIGREARIIEKWV